MWFWTKRVLLFLDFDKAIETVGSYLIVPLIDPHQIPGGPVQQDRVWLDPPRRLLAIFFHINTRDYMLIDER